MMVAEHDQCRAENALSHFFSPWQVQKKRQNKHARATIVTILTDFFFSEYIVVIERFVIGICIIDYCNILILFIVSINACSICTYTIVTSMSKNRRSLIWLSFHDDLKCSFTLHCYIMDWSPPTQLTMVD